MPLSLRTKLTAGAAIAGAVALYLNWLPAMGLVGPDEPRYAAIGEAMARTGDWVTPALWGKPWFEKPPLLYWMTGGGYMAGLGPDLAPRLPVALLSLLFLAVLWWRVRIEWGNSVALRSTMLCATSAGWLAYSHVAVTDLPMSAFFTLAVVLALPWVAGSANAKQPARGLWLPAACLGVAALGKGLVPLALFLPVVATGAFHGGWRRVADWLRPAPLLTFAAVALPWYVLCTLRNGNEFLRVLFVEQHFQRLHSAGLQHVQPWWFYLPVLLLLLFPWFPLLAALPTGLRPFREDPRIQALISVAVFGLLLFSAAVNKLPGYLLPLVPAFCILSALVPAAESAAPAGSRNEAVSILAAVAAMIGLFPALSQVVPVALGRGFRAAAIPWGTAALGVAIGGGAGWLLAVRFRRVSFSVLSVAAAAGYLWFEGAAFPSLDRAASARPVWLSSHPSCVPTGASRNLLYGLYYYSGKELPGCTLLDPDARAVVR